VNQPAEFFVGYFQLPPGLRRFVTRLGAAVLLLTPIGAAALALSMPASPGAPTTDYGQALDGVFIAQPYGMVWTGGAAGLQATLLVQGGKHGVISPGDPLDGHAVRVSGQLLARDGTRMLELGEAMRAAPEPGPGPILDQLRAATRDLGEVTVRGEIEDSKCYLGRMRPGSGAAHRACAKLCVRGGIPPLLVTRDGHGHEVAYVLATRGGQAINADILPFLVEPVEVRGRLLRMGELLILQTDPASVRRL